MATSEISICNNALRKLGANVILSLNEDSDNARLCKAFYEPNRDSLLRLHNWNFAMKRSSLALSTSVPAYGFANKFALPADLLRVWQVERSHINFKIENRFLLSNEGSIKILYVSKIVDSSLFDPLFVETLSSRLAREMAIPVTDSRTMMESMNALYRNKLSEAKNMDGMEGKPDELIINTFLNSRR